MENHVESPLAADDTTALLEQVYQPEKPMEQAAPTSTQTPTPEAARTFKLKVKDQEFELPEPEVLSLAQKGKDYEINNRLLRQERELLELKKKELDGFDPERFKELKQLDEYSRQNPKFLEVVKAQWERFAQGKTEPTSETAHPMTDELSKLKQEVSGLKTFIESKKTQEEDQALAKSITDLSTKFPEVNLGEKDQFGYTTEHRVLKHMTEKNLPTFKAAFMDLYGERVIEMREKKAAEKVAKDIQDRYNKGLVLNKRLSSLNVFRPSAPTNESYDDIAARSIKELGLGG